MTIGQNKLYLLSALPLALFALTACSSSQTMQEGKVEPQRPRRIIFGDDITGSYMRDNVVDLQVKFFLMNARRGDTWIFRWIGRYSYSDRAARQILPGRTYVTIPELPSKPSNPFDTQANRDYQTRLRRVQEIKLQVARSLKSQKSSPEKGTDIWGFLKKAEELKPTHVVMFSDMSDTMGNKVALNLRNVHVYVLCFQSGRNPREAQKRKTFWTSVLEQAGARVTFHDISEPLPLLD